MAYEVVQLPVWRDNYAYLLLGEHEAAVVDSPEAGPILAELERRGRRLTHIFNTHHHGDHVGANRELLEHFPELEVWGSVHDRDKSRIPGQTRALSDGDSFTFAGVGCTVRDVPAHTLGHIIYIFDDGRAFVGDTSFVGGCGRLFEGTAAQMDRALNEVLSRLPDDTLLYCAHEYTASNLRFALSVDGDNAQLRAYANEVVALRAEDRPTVPSTVGLEKAINPFYRADAPALRAAVCLPDAPRHEVLGALRALKDSF